MVNGQHGANMEFVASPVVVELKKEKENAAILKHNMVVNLVLVYQSILETATPIIALLMVPGQNGGLGERVQ